MSRTANQWRAEKAYRAVLNYEHDSSVEECISDLLGDLRHLCDESGYDFAERDQVGYRNYIGELADAGTAEGSAHPAPPEEVDAVVIGDRIRVSIPGEDAYRWFPASTAESSLYR